MKVKELFETFEEPYRSKALNNLNPEHAETNHNFHIWCVNIIDFRFYFKRDIPERWIYWENYCTYLNVKTIIYQREAS